MLEIAKKTEIHGFIRHAERQIDQIIAHAEKVSSIFEPHTELISKGKAGVSQKLGPRVCILDDQHQFILHHQVMEQKNDDQVTVSMMLEAKAPFPKLNLCEFGGGLSDQCAGSTWARPVSRSWHHGFKRYVALAVVARNIYRIGAIVSQPALSRLQRAAKYSERKTTYKLAI